LSLNSSLKSTIKSETKDGFNTANNNNINKPNSSLTSNNSSTSTDANNNNNATNSNNNNLQSSSSTQDQLQLDADGDSSGGLSDWADGSMQNHTWKKEEREKFKKALLAHGFGRWDKLLPIVFPKKLPNMSDEEIKTDLERFGVHFVIQILRACGRCLGAFLFSMCFVLTHSLISLFFRH
jgi:hypothetical protein